MDDVEDVDVDAYFLSLGEALPHTRSKERPLSARNPDRSARALYTGERGSLLSKARDDNVGDGWAPVWTSPQSRSPSQQRPGTAAAANRGKDSSVRRGRQRPRTSREDLLMSPGSWSQHTEEDEVLSVDLTRDLLEDVRRLAESNASSSPSSPLESSSNPGSVKRTGYNQQHRGRHGNRRGGFGTSPYDEVPQPRLKGGSSVEQAHHLKATVREQARELEAVHEDMARKDVELWAAKQAAEEEVVGSKALRKALEGLENDLAQERKLRKLAETKAKDTVLSGSEAFEETRRKLHAAEHARDVALQEARQANKMRDEVASRSAETCAELRAQVKHLEKEHASVNEELAQNKAALTDVSVQRSELAAARQKHIEELKKELEEALSRSRRLAAEKDKVESRLLQVEGAAARAQLFSERLEEAETELDGVRQELAAAQKAEREQLTRCGALESSLQSVKNQLASAEARAIQAEAKLGAYANERANRAATHIDLERTREDLKATKAFIASLEEEKKTLKSKLESTQGRARELETRAEHFQRSLQIVQLQVTQACSASESSFATDEELGSSSLHSTGLENSEVAAEVQPALESVRALGRMHADAKSRLAKALRDAEIAQSSSRDALGQVAGLEQKIRELETEVAQTRDRLGEAKTHARAQNADLQEAHHCVVAMESELHRERDTYQRATHAVRRRLLRAQLDCLTGSCLVRPVRELASYEVETSLEDLADTVGRLLDHKAHAAESLAARVKTLESQLGSVARRRLLQGQSRPESKLSDDDVNHNGQLRELDEHAVLSGERALQAIASKTMAGDGDFKELEARAMAMRCALELAMTCLMSALQRIDQLRAAPRISETNTLEHEVQSFHEWVDSLFGPLLPHDRVASNPFKSRRHKISTSSPNTPDAPPQRKRRLRLRTVARVVTLVVSLCKRCRGAQSEAESATFDILRKLRLGRGTHWKGLVEVTEAVQTLLVSASSREEIWKVLWRTFTKERRDPAFRIQIPPVEGPRRATVAEEDAFEELRHALMYYENEIGRELESWRGKEEARMLAHSRVPTVAEHEVPEAARVAKPTPASGDALDRLRREQMEAQAELERALAQLNSQMDSHAN